MADPRTNCGLSDAIPCDPSKMACKASHPKNLNSFFEFENEFQVHTGNINEWLELRFKGFQNSQEELRECLKLQLSRWDPGRKGQRCTCPEQGVFLCLNDTSSSVKDENRADLKITLKVFINDLAHFESQVEAAIDSVMRELEIDHVEQLIISFPEINVECPPEANEKQVAQVWLDAVKPIWKRLEALVEEERRAVTLGVADLDLNELQALYEWAPSVKPEIDHYNIEGCCTIPVELSAYCKSNDIALLTHNDPPDFPGEHILHQVCTDQLHLECEQLKKWKTSWAARYTVLIRTRSVVTKKGYVVRFMVAPNKT